MSRRHLAALTALVALLLSACGVASATGKPLPEAPTAAAPAAPSSTPAPTLTHVFVVVLENASYAEAMAQPDIAALAARSGVATDYHAVGHPSLPNYLALTSGSTYGIADDGYHVLPASGLGAQLDAAGLGWRAYFQGMTRGCFQSPPPYALKHNPFAYYGGACPTAGQVAGLEQLDADLALPAAQAPRLSWITPDLCNDGHDCGPAAAGRFLAQLVPKVEASPAWRRGGVLYVTWDEDDGSAANRVLLLADGRGISGTTAAPYNHYSLLATIEDLLHVGRLGQAAPAAAMTDLEPPPQ